RFGGVEFRLGRVELGHLHGDHLADLPLPRAIRDEVVASGRARPHHVLPDSGWISRPIRTETDARDVVALFRSSYDRLRARRPASAGA
ncbi:MAG: luciferase family protein, partial [Actinomycetota bacterium]